MLDFIMRSEQPVANGFVESIHIRGATIAIRGTDDADFMMLLAVCCSSKDSSRLRW
jgi:hypothetical protein